MGDQKNNKTKPEACVMFDVICVLIETIHKTVQDAGKKQGNKGWEGTWFERSPNFKYE